MSKDRVQKTLSYELYDAGRDGSLRNARDALDRGLGQGANLNWRDKDGRTVLHQACLNAHIDVFRLLLEEGAAVDVADKKGLTVVDYALGLDCAYDRDKILEVLLKRYPEYAAAAAGASAGK